ncbi:MAG: fatty acid desaturase, partial [Pseudomonadota bacterium]
MARQPVSEPPSLGVEWLTLLLILGCYAAWITLVTCHTLIGWPMAALGLIPLVVIHSSLQHEAIHAHPTNRAWLNEALVFPSLWMVMPWRRYRDTHLTHHRTGRLTDPLEDPESHYLWPDQWETLPRWAQRLLTLQGSLIGRVTLGPIVLVVRIITADWREYRQGNKTIPQAWAMHLTSITLVTLVLAFAGVPLWLYALTVVWPATSILMVRGYVEHRPAERQRERSVLVEAGPMTSLLFLNNNLHALHHQRPNLAWYELAPLYRRHRDRLIV